MTYNNGDGLVFEFNAHWTYPEPDVGWPGGWEIFVTEIQKLNEEGETIETITSQTDIDNLVTNASYNEMVRIAKGTK